MQHSENRSPTRVFLDSVVERMRPIEGWLADAEACLLVATVAEALKALPDARAIVEIGSYCGKSTVVLGSAVNAATSNEIKIFAIDPHEGVVGAQEYGLQQMPPTLESFQRNIRAAGLEHLVEIVRQYSFEVEWNQPICLLFIDGLHDYINVVRDFNHFESWVSPGGFVAFHDYGDHFPGVKRCVDEVIAEGRYLKVRSTWSLIVLRKKTEAELSLTAGETT